MPTQEERLTALEQKFVEHQWEVRHAIQDLNANSTIMLGLIHKLAQESTQTAMRVEMMRIRLDRLDTKFDAHTALLNEHTKVLGEHTSKLDEHTRILGEHTSKLDEHTRILSEHTVRLDRIETRLDEHTVRFDHIDTALAQILARLPEQ